MLAEYFGKNGQDHRYKVFYSKYIGKDDLVFDVGANHGNRTNIFLKLRANVIAFEPQSNCATDLECKYGRKRRFTLEKVALDNKEGELVMKISNADTISTISEEFINRVTASGRFSNYKWADEEKVKTTTLDNMIIKYGTPKFIKIDVEGFESNVITGLHSPVEIISFEFTPEFLEPTLSSISHISGLADYAFNYSFGESMEFQSEHNLDSDEIIDALINLSDGTVFGDVYAFKK